MVFIETTVFTRQLFDLLGDEEYIRLQERLVKNPEEGALIGGAGGLRKIRLGCARTGKRGGLRIIYYWHAKSDVLLLLAIYSKKNQEDLTLAQRKILKSIVENEYP